MLSGLHLRIEGTVVKHHVVADCFIMIAASVSGAIVVNSQKRHALIGLVVLVQLINDIKLCSV